MISDREILALAYNIRMKSETAARILSLNHQFYQSFAEDFSETRQRLQPGVLQVVDRFPPESSVLDVGCGNGELARELVKRGLDCSYLGIDFSANLLKKATLVGKVKLMYAKIFAVIFRITVSFFYLTGSS